jgi:tRNA A-37 threonylcarbamoyl transferase component Bud32/tetratricopeptide (TPR) repeat protein
MPTACGLVLFSLLLGVCAPGTAQDKNESKAAHALYQKAIKKKSARERMAALREAAARYPGAAELHYGLGSEFYQRARLDSAAVRFERVVALDAELTQRANLHTILAAVYSTLASQHLGRGKLVAAVETALAGLQHDANSVSCLTTAMVAYQQLGEYEQAVNTGLRLIALQPSARNCNNLGAAYESKGDWLSAKKYYSEALALAPHLAEARNNLSRVNNRLEQQKAASAAADKPIAVSSKKKNDLREKISLKKGEPPENKTTEKNAAPAAAAKSSKPAPPDLMPKVASSDSVWKEAPDVKSEALAQSAPSAPAAEMKLEPSRTDGSEDASEAAAPAEPVTTFAPKSAINPGSPVWILGLSGVAFLAVMFLWRLFRHRASALRQATKKMPSDIQLTSRLAATSQSEKHEGETRQPEPQLELAATSLGYEATGVSLHLLQRAAASSAEPAGSDLTSTSPAGDANLHPSSEDLPEPAAAESILAPEPVTGAEALPASEKTAPSFGLQTEVLFTDPISGALDSLQEHGEHERVKGKEQNTVTDEAREHTRETPRAVPANGALTQVAEPAGALLNLNGKAQDKNPASGLLAVTPVEPIPAPSSGPSDIRRDFVEPRRDKPMDSTTMSFVAGVEEMMHEPVEGKSGGIATAAPATAPPAAAPSAEAAGFLATRTMEISTVGQQRIGRYLIEKEIARAATGRIYKAWDPKLDRTVVLKTVQYGFATSTQEIAGLKDRIYREARAIAKLNHTNIVIVYDVDDQPEFSYLVMEYLDGRDLKQVLETERRMDCGRALHIVMQVCDAMEYAHRSGVFHRDVKPSNIMLLDNDETKVTDFGIAKISNYLSLTQTGRVLGTPSYMAPEQIEGHATDGRADLFSIGVVLYELIAGKRPFVADSLAALAYKIVHKPHIPPSLENVELPMELDEVLQRSLAKSPGERYQSATEFREALLAVKGKLA